MLMSSQSPAPSRLFTEASQAADCVERQKTANGALLAPLIAQLRNHPPRAVVTCARGSSDHAATFARYLIETRLRLLTSSVSPSISSIYEVRQQLDQCLFLGISQSGASPDLVAAASAAKDAGATVVAVVNVEESPLAAVAHHVIPLRAGMETSVAATKSFIASLFALAHLVAAWSAEADLLNELARAPELLTRAWKLDWSEAVIPLRDCNSLYTLGRGLTLGIAQEAALKFKETSAIHAEAFSSAEVRHGPMALFQNRMPALIFAQNDATLPGQQALASELVMRGTPVLFAGTAPAGTILLPALDAHPAVAPLLFAQSFYRVLDDVARARGCDPDRPPLLNKVTQTR